MGRLGNEQGEEAKESEERANDGEEVECMYKTKEINRLVGILPEVEGVFLVCQGEGSWD